MLTLCKHFMKNVISSFVYTLTGHSYISYSLLNVYRLLRKYTYNSFIYAQRLCATNKANSSFLNRVKYFLKGSKCDSFKLNLNSTQI